MPFLVLAAVVRGGAGCQGSTVVDRVSGVALTASTATFTTIGGEEGYSPATIHHPGEGSLPRYAYSVIAL